MGGTSSKSSAELTSKSVVVNQTDMNIFNSNVNTVTTNSIIENAKNCSVAINQNQAIAVGDLNVGAGSNTSISQDQIANLDFTCLQKDEVQMNVINAMVDSIQSQLTNNANSDILNKLKATAEAKTQNEFQLFPWGGGSSDSSVKQKVENYVTNNSNTTIKNMVENATFANFKNSNISTCIAQIMQNQQQNYGKIVTGEDSTLVLSQSQKVNAVIDCIQQAEIATKVLSDIAKFAGTELEVKNTTVTKSEMVGAAKAEMEQKGIGSALSQVISSIGQAYSNVIGAIFGGVGGIFSFGGGGSSGTLFSIICCCCCCLLLIMLVGGGGFMFFGKGSDASAEGVDLETGTVDASVPTEEALQQGGSIFFGNYLSEYPRK
jgi:hypothetical protein